jgi:tetratricopeptide (TPR) repeat protein
MPRSAASVSEFPLVLPTYALGAPEVNPLFFAGEGCQGARRSVYPYPFLDKLSDTRVDKTYKAVCLENEYLQITVLPELGGRIFAGLDKTDRYDFFYRQRVIKPAMIGMLGAWISGGVEWNLPHHHRATSFMPVDWRAEEHADGSQTVWVGEVELRHRMKWAVGMTVVPGRSYLKITFKIFNRTPLAHSMLCFTNAAVHVNPQYRVIYPPAVEYGVQHAKHEFIRWPISHEVYAGVDYRKGVDVSWWKNHPNPVSIFAWHDHEDFLAGYDFSKDAGVARVADHNVSPGMKFFTFGTGGPGEMWHKNILSDGDTPYLELMSGAYSDNQPDYSWIEPTETRVAEEYWYPIRNLGGVKCATRDAAVNLVVRENVARLAFNATSNLKGATVLLKAGGRVLLDRRIDINPAQPFSIEVALPKGVQETDLKTALIAVGKELVAYRPARPKGAEMPKPMVPPGPPAEMKTNEELYLTGLRLEQFHNPALDPYAYYNEALKRDPADYRTNVALGILHLKRGLYAEAEKHLRSAVARATENYTRAKDGEAHYYLGVTLKARGEYAEALDALNRAAWCFAWRAASCYEIAEINVRQGDLGAALTSIEHSLAFNALNPKALNFKAALLRHMGSLKEAQEAATEALRLDPLDWRARNEQLLALTDAGRPPSADKSAQARKELDALLRGEPQNYLELASDYQNLVLWDDAIDVLDRFLRLSPKNIDPMVHYTLGYYWEQRGNAAKTAALTKGHSERSEESHTIEAQQCQSRETLRYAQGDGKAAHQQALRHYRLGEKMPPDYCFPFRHESIPVLESAMVNNPKDARAPYYLGNLLFDSQPQRGMRMWERSRRLDGGFARTHRNLAFGYMHFAEDSAKAVRSLKKAIALDPNDARFLLELDLAMAAAQMPHRERLQFLERRHRVVAGRNDALLREIVLHVSVGDYDRAIELMSNRHFHVAEGGENTVHEVHVDAHLLRGRKFLAAGDPASALKDFETAMEYPPRFEFARPYDGAREPEINWCLGAAHEALGNEDQARRCFTASVAKERRGTALAYWQGQAYRSLGREKAAHAMFDDLVRTGKATLTRGAESGFFDKFGQRRSETTGRAQAHYLIGLGLLGLGKRALAKAEFQTALKSDINALGAQTMLEAIRCGGIEVRNRKGMRRP